MKLNMQKEIFKLCSEFQKVYYLELRELFFKNDKNATIYCDSTLILHLVGN